MSKKVILLTAGGTGGHFFPALALAEEFNLHKNLEVHLVTDNRCSKYISKDIKIKSHLIDLYITLNSLPSKLKLPFLVIVAVFRAALLLQKLKPSVVIGFGGYPTFPIMFVSQLIGITTIIYEQNSFLGKSNKIFAKKAQIIALAYEYTRNLPPSCKDKTIVTGDFVRSNILKLEQKIKFDNKPFTLLVIGGSQGAKFFSELVSKAIIILINKYPKIKLNVIQQVVKEDQESIRKIYEELKVKNIIADFFHDIYNYYERCNLVIARSGATTIAELTQLGQPAIFIPFPYAADDHQYYNAKALADTNSSWFYRQQEITPIILADKLYELISNPSLIQKASKNLLKRKKTGTKNLVATVLKIIA